jgi:hypothetical protein
VNEMKTLQKLIFTLVLMAGCTLAASAQKDGDKPPPKGKAPVVKPQPKPPPDNSNKGRGHGEMALRWIRDDHDV